MVTRSRIDDRCDREEAIWDSESRVEVTGIKYTESGGEGKQGESRKKLNKGLPDVLRFTATEGLQEGGELVLWKSYGEAKENLLTLLPDAGIPEQ